MTGPGMAFDPRCGRGARVISRLDCNPADRAQSAPHGKHPVDGVGDC